MNGTNTKKSDEYEAYPMEAKRIKAGAHYVESTPSTS